MVEINDLSMEGLKILLTLAIVVLGIAITLIGYFMSKRDDTITQATENLTKAVQQLENIVNGLQMQYEIRQPIVDERLKNHSNQLNDHEARVSKLETEHDIYHCNHPKKGSNLRKDN